VVKIATFAKPETVVRQPRKPLSDRNLQKRKLLFLETFIIFAPLNITVKGRDKCSILKHDF
jgi:hypothetical protein